MSWSDGLWGLGLWIHDFGAMLSTFDRRVPMPSPCELCAPVFLTRGVWGHRYSCDPLRCCDLGHALSPAKLRRQNAKPLAGLHHVRTLHVVCYLRAVAFLCQFRPSENLGPANGAVAISGNLDHGLGVNTITPSSDPDSLAHLPNARGL